MQRVVVAQSPADALEEGLVMVFTYCPVKVPEDKRWMVADYINRVNYGLNLGCLDMDADVGEVRARSTGPVQSDEAPSAGVLGPLFDSSSYLIDNWLPGLLRVAFGSDDPSTAYAATRATLRSDHSEPLPSDIQDDLEAAPELTAIEQEVSKLHAERVCKPESPPPSA